MITEADARQDMDRISIIIRNKNEEKYIGYAIQSCLDHFKSPEIIVVDNESTDNSMDIVRMFEYASIKNVSISDYSPGKSLNLGFRNASREVVLVLSAHCVIKNINYNFKNIKEQLKLYPVIFGKQIPIYKGKRITPRYIWSHFGDKEEQNMHSNIEQRPFLHNAFCFYDKNYVLLYPFDESLSGKEDRYWARDFIKREAKTEKTYLYSPELVCEHHFTNNGATWKGLG